MVTPGKGGNMHKSVVSAALCVALAVSGFGLTHRTAFAEAPQQLFERSARCAQQTIDHSLWDRLLQA